MNKSDFENITSTLTNNGKAGKLPTSNKFYNPITKPSKKYKFMSITITTETTKHTNQTIHIWKKWRNS